MKCSNSWWKAAWLAAGMLALPVAWAESQVSDPGAFGIAVDPNADGTKIYGPVTLSYVYEDNSSCSSGRFVRNLYAVASFTKGNLTQPFNTNYTAYAADPANQQHPNLAACFDDQDKQVELLRYFIANVIIPKFFGCTGSACPGFTVKSIKNFLTTGVGAGYMDVVLAVK